MIQPLVAFLSHIDTLTFFITTWIVSPRIVRATSDDHVLMSIPSEFQNTANSSLHPKRTWWTHYSRYPFINIVSFGPSRTVTWRIETNFRQLLLNSFRAAAYLGHVFALFLHRICHNVVYVTLFCHSLILQNQYPRFDKTVFPMSSKVNSCYCLFIDRQRFSLSFISWLNDTWL